MLKNIVTAFIVMQLSVIKNQIVVPILLFLPVDFIALILNEIMQPECCYHISCFGLEEENWHFYQHLTGSLSEQQF